MFFRKAETPSIDRRRSLAGIPVLNRGVRRIDGENDTLVLGVPVARRAGFLARFQPAVTDKRIRLDEVGSFVVRQIDGERNMMAIIEALIARYGLNRREAELSTVDFMKSLIRKQAVSIVIQ
jgi:hypothetical protein